MIGSALLPTSAEPYEHGLAIAGTETLPIPFTQLLDPATAPAEWLPFLAVHEGVRLWFADWSEARKRQTIAEWSELAGLVGTRAAAKRFLDYVDAEIVHKVSYPSIRPVGRMAIGLTPIQHKHHAARFLLKTALTPPPRAMIVGRSATGRAAIRSVDVTPQARAMTAVAVSKAPETAYAVTFAHRVPVALDDSFDLDAGHVLGSFKDRTRL